jgi:hypothetical protein
VAGDDQQDRRRAKVFDIGYMLARLRLCPRRAKLYRKAVLHRSDVIHCLLWGVSPFGQISNTALHNAERILNKRLTVVEPCPNETLAKAGPLRTP